MERSEWDDDERDDAPRPLPAHERSWRHPSEMAASSRVTDSVPREPGPHWLSGRSGRGLSVAAGVVGLVIAAGLLQLLLPLGSPDAAPVDVTLATRAARADAPVTIAPVTSEPDTDPVVTAPATTTPATPTATAPATSAESPVRPVPLLVDQPGTVGFEGMSAVAVPLGEEGFLVTTAAAVSGRGSRFEVVLPDGQRGGATLVATGSDLAVLRLDVNILQMEPVRFADADLRPEGSWVTVFGERPSRAVLVATDNGLALAGLGSPDLLPEGAPVVDDSGRVVGLCSRAVGAPILVLTHPANEVKASAREQAWLGIAGSPGAPADGPAPQGVLVVDVVPGSPAAAAWLLPGDDIITLDGVPVASIVQLAEMIAAAVPGDDVTLGIVRGGVQLEILVELGTRPYST